MEAVAPAPALAPYNDSALQGITAPEAQSECSIAGTEAVKQLGTIVPTTVSERQARELSAIAPEHRAEIAGHPGPRNEPSKTKESIDLGLAVAAAVRSPGQCFTVEDLADICECSPQRISQLQARAMRKLRIALETSGVDWRRVMRDLQPGETSEYRVSGLHRRNDGKPE